jgi:tetratricopeptide (TPR) repeat protein
VLRAGNYRRAKKVAIRAVAIAELHVVPDQYPRTFLFALHALCGVYIALKEYGRAQPIAERQLALEEQFQGPKVGAVVGAALNNMAICLKGQGKLSEASSLYERALAITERVHGPNHTEVASSLSNVGVLYLEQGDHRRAKGVLERMWSSEKQNNRLGDVHIYARLRLAGT